MTSTWGLLRIALGAAVAASACLPAWADIQRCVGPNGAVTFTDQGCPASPDAKHTPGAEDGELLPAEPAAAKTAAKPAAAHPAADSAADPPAASAPAKK